MDKKKLAAATAAVFTYIKTQEEAAFYASGGAPMEAVSDVPQTPSPAPVMFNAWGTAGRSDQMQGRFLMQTRVFR